MNEIPGEPCPAESCETFVTNGPTDYTAMDCQCPYDDADITICLIGSFNPNPEGTKCCQICCLVCQYPNEDPTPEPYEKYYRGVWRNFL